MNKACTPYSLLVCACVDVGVYVPEGVSACKNLCYGLMKSVRCGRVCVGVNLHTLVVSVAEE